MTGKARSKAMRASLAPELGDLGIPPRTVDPALEEATLTVSDGVRAILEEPRTNPGGVSRTRVLVLDRPPGPAARGYTVRAEREIVIDGWSIPVQVEAEQRAALRERATRSRADAAHGGPTEIRAIIPGRVLSIAVAKGDAIEAGERMMVLEAMKMQNELRAPRAGTIGRLAATPGQTIELGDLLLVIE